MFGCTEQWGLYVRVFVGAWVKVVVRRGIGGIHRMGQRRVGQQTGVCPTGE